jgi:hypothetical protein
MLSDLELIREFVNKSIKKEDILLSNASLSAQTVYTMNQLMAKSEGIIATASFSNTLTGFLIQFNSSYWELINQVLAESNYLLKGEMDNRGFYRYQRHEVPKGYQMHCSKSVLLWRAWWKHRQKALRGSIPLELLIKKRDSWYPIKDLTISDGLLYLHRC